MTTSARVLLVMDDHDRIEDMAAALYRLGCRVTTVRNARQALEASTVRPFDVVVLPAQFPESAKAPEPSGEAVLSRLRANLPDLQGILLGDDGTADTPSGLARGVFARVGASCCLTKLCDLVDQAFNWRCEVTQRREAPEAAARTAELA